MPQLLSSLTTLGGQPSGWSPFTLDLENKDGISNLLRHPRHNATAPLCLWCLPHCPVARLHTYACILLGCQEHHGSVDSGEPENVA